MLKKSITFKDLDGNTLTEDFYFNLNKAEIAEMELSQQGGLSEYLKKITAENDGAKLVAMFKELIQKSVGKRSEDGRRFIKDQDVVNDFMQTDAYSELFVELATKADAAAEFIKGIVPADMEAQIANAAALEGVPNVADAVNGKKDYDALLKDPNWEPSKADLVEMSQAQLQAAFARKNTSQ